MISHVHKEPEDLIWKKLLKIMFLVKRTRWEGLVYFCELFEKFVGS